ncbi:amidase [Rhodococcus pyridinivorans]|uniref:amidase n=1 Tax=Rhodococcus pyridinivorans TaxID=103816 RepID=UPI0002FCB69D|nr:amidase [Rhodococcus pyridinivorans]AWZ24464.1 amidase [Rhodococcus pyridinivorans]
MTTTDYPDLTAASATTVDDLLPQARADMEPLLAAGRRTPLASVPDGPACEPAHSTALLAASPVPASPIEAPAHAVRTDTPVHELGVLDLLAAYRSGAITPTDVLTALRARWSDPELSGGAVLAVIDGADGAAADSDRRWSTGTARPLEGVFFAVKDIIDVAGAPVTAGSRTTGDRIAATDATVVARLRAAGAIPVLMTATTEFACGAPHNARYGAVTNPWDRNRWTGGSSTGSAGALAERLVPLALGTDTGGSIRVPSALCNLTGIKPTYGLVPRTGVASLSWTLDHIGPMARSAADLRLALEVLAGPDGYDPAAVPDETAQQVQDGLVAAGTAAAPSLAGVRLGVPTTWFTELCDAGVLAAWETVVDTFRTLGAEIVSVDIPEAHQLHDDVTIVMTCELASNQEGALEKFALYDVGTQVRIARGLVPSAVDYLRSVRRRTLAQQDAIRAFDTAGIDVLVTPGIGATAARLSDVTMEIDGVRYPMQSIVGRNTGLFDYLGLPAVMAPAGFSDGMPVGVQLVGRPWADDTCLRLAQVLQSVTDVHDRRADG